jgi:ATP-binding cassette subfamily F protein uup
MDEPTNDLDIDTLELLEEYVSEFPGTLLLVSHDRAFLDNVVTSLLVFEGDGRVRDFVGGYSDWLNFSRERPVAPARPAAKRPTHAAVAAAAPAPAQAQPAKPRKLSYRDQRELDTLPELLQRLESEKQQLDAELSDASLYRGDQDMLRQRLARLTALSAQIDTAYSRWNELETLKGSA